MTKSVLLKACCHWREWVSLLHLLSKPDIGNNFNAAGIKCVNSRNPDLFVQPFCGEYGTVITRKNNRVK